MRLRKKILIAALALPLLGIILFLAWASKTSDADPVKLQAFIDQAADAAVISEFPSYWEIRPKNGDCPDEACRKSLETGVIFYPGAKIDSRAYLYKLGFLSDGKPYKTTLFITKPPLRLAFFGIGQADKIIKKNPGITRWILGGHSLGGSMACEYAKSHAEKISELFLLGSYCGSSIHDTRIKVVSIHGSEDGVMTPQKVAENDKNLPDSHVDDLIAGMNHAQAGNYGDQSGDKAAIKSDDAVKTEIMAIFEKEL